MITSNTVCIWLRGRGSQQRSRHHPAPLTFTRPDCVSATCPPSVTMSVPAGALGSTEVAPHVAPFILAGGSTDVFDSSICYPTKQVLTLQSQGKKSQAQNRTGTAMEEICRRRAAVHLMEMRREIRQFGKSKAHALLSGGWLKQQKVCVCMRACVCACVCVKRDCVITV